MRYSEHLKEPNLPKAKITALGCYTPPRLLTNQDLEKLVDTNNQWILDRTGIRERHLAAKEWRPPIWRWKPRNARCCSAA